MAEDRIETLTQDHMLSDTQRERIRMRLVSLTGKLELLSHARDTYRNRKNDLNIRRNIVKEIMGYNAKKRTVKSPRFLPFLVEVVRFSTEIKMIRNEIQLAYELLEKMDRQVVLNYRDARNSDLVNMLVESMACSLRHEELPIENFDREERLRIFYRVLQLGFDPFRKNVDGVCAIDRVFDELLSWKHSDIDLGDPTFALCQDIGHILLYHLLGLEWEKDEWILEDPHKSDVQHLLLEVFESRRMGKRTAELYQAVLSDDQVYPNNTSSADRHFCIKLFSKLLEHSDAQFQGMDDITEKTMLRMLHCKVFLIVCGNTVMDAAESFPFLLHPACRNRSHDPSSTVRYLWCECFFFQMLVMQVNTTCQMFSWSSMTRMVENDLGVNILNKCPMQLSHVVELVELVWMYRPQDRFEVDKWLEERSENLHTADINRFVLYRNLGNLVPDMSAQSFGIPLVRCTLDPDSVAFEQEKKAALEAIETAKRTIVQLRNQLGEVCPLKLLCRRVLLQHCRWRDIPKLKLPPMLADFVQFGDLPRDHSLRKVMSGQVVESL